MKLCPICIFICLTFWVNAQNSVHEICTDYIQEWKHFYPTKALKQGFNTSIFGLEDFSEPSIDKWITYNQKVLDHLIINELLPGSADRINARLLKTQIQKELDVWLYEQPHKNSLKFYSTIIYQNLKTIATADFITMPERDALYCSNMPKLADLCHSASINLRADQVTDNTRGINDLTEILNFIDVNLGAVGNINIKCTDFDIKKRMLTEALKSLIQVARENNDIKELNIILGRNKYDEKLARYVDDFLTSETLGKLALEEINATKVLILQKSKEYLRQQYPQKEMPDNDSTIIARAFDDMEKDAPQNGAEYLEFWNELYQSALEFLRQTDLVTLPKHETLRILPAPESAGPAARIGWVDVAPPFAPNPLTTLYIPSIPDTLPMQEQNDFWASFNKPFNRMIAIHEISPGHYMQFLIARETPHHIRLLFPYGPYIEGWATFIEVVALEHGWESERPLTYLAHLRKRLENANRAYMSVKVHCDGWNQDQVMKFSSETALLAPQFAKSLWGRLLQSPMQITSYYYGGRLIHDLLAAEKERLGSSFEMKYFLDTILKAGPIPIDEFYSIFQYAKS